jgi:hypothetical protein
MTDPHGTQDVESAHDAGGARHLAGVDHRPDTRRPGGGQGLSPSSRAPSCTPQMKSSTLGSWSFGLPVGDEHFVGPFLLLDDFLLGLACLLEVVVPRWPGGRTSASGGTSGELELAALVGVEARTHECVVMVLGDEVPAQHGELAGGRDGGGDLEASPGLDPVVERSEWAGGSGRAVNDGRKLTPWGTRPSIEGQSSAVADTRRTRLRPASRGLAVPNHASCAASVSPVGPALTTSTSTGVRFMVRSLSARAGPDDRPQPRSGLVARTSTDQNPSATGWLSVISTSANPTPVSWAR